MGQTERTSKNSFSNLDGDPPLELRGCSKSGNVYGFAAKHDSGKVKNWGWVSDNFFLYLTDWAELGGPVIGIHFIDYENDLSLIIGDPCRPKFFGAFNLQLKIGEQRDLEFYWQTTHPEYISQCLSKGLFYLSNPELLAWVNILDNKVAIAIYPMSGNIYSSKSYLSI